MTTTSREDIVELVKLGKRYRERRSKWQDFWTRLIAEVLFVPIHGWLFMLGVGIVHGSWWPAVPTVGFWWACIIAAVFRSVFAASGSKSS